MATNKHAKTYPLLFHHTAPFSILVGAVRTFPIIDNPLIILMSISGTNGYNNDTSRYANSTFQQSACSVEPGNAEDVGKIVSCNAVLSLWNAVLIYVCLYSCRS